MKIQLFISISIIIIVVVVVVVVVVGCFIYLFVSRMTRSFNPFLMSIFMKNNRKPKTNSR